MKSLYGELCSISIDKVVCTMVEAILPRNTENKVLSVSIRFEAENFEKDHLVRKNLLFVFYRGSNYTFVGSPISDPDNKLSNIFFSGNKETELKRFSYHDSCWRSDGVTDAICNIAQDIEKECNQGKKADYSVFTTIEEVKLHDGSITVHDYDRNSIFTPITK